MAFELLRQPGRYLCFAPFLLLVFTDVAVAIAGEFSFTVIDAQSRLPIASRIYVRNETTGENFFVRIFGELAAVPYFKQSRANRDSMEHHTTVPAAKWGVDRLPEGKYSITIEKGKEYFPRTIRLDLAVDEVRPHEVIELERWSDVSRLGWYSGETHLHRPLNELPVLVLAEDLNVSMPITYWVIDAYMPPKPWEKNPPGPIPDRLLEVDKSHVIWPRNTEYEITKVSKTPHTLGALFVLNHAEQLPLGAPDWKPIAEHARSVGALMDMDKLDWPFAITLPHTTGATLYELANNHMWRTEFGLKNWVSSAPAFLQQPMGGTHGNECDWLAYTLGQYYTLLDAGFRLVPTAGTASGVHPVPPGFGRVYVHLNDGFSYEKWLEGLTGGRSFVTTGPMILAELDRQHPGSTLKAGVFDFSGEVISEYPIATLEIVRNGQVESQLPLLNQRLESGAYRNSIQNRLTVDTSGWICLRCTEDRPDRRLRFAHTASWWLDVANKPLLPTEQEKDYLIERITIEIHRSKDVLPASALAEYFATLEYFESLQVRDPQ